MITQLAQLTKTINEIQIEQRLNQEKISQFLLDKRVVNLLNHKIDFKSKYNLEIPFALKENFEEFNDQLKNDQYLKNDTVSKTKLLIIVK